MTESIQITELSMKDYEFVNRAYHVLHKEHVNGRPDIYVDTEELLTREEYQEILESDEYVAVGAKAGEKLVEDYRRRGVGKQLYACMETLAKKEKLKRIDLKVWSFNREAYAFYKSLGLEIQCCIMEKRFKD